MIEKNKSFKLLILSFALLLTFGIGSPAKGQERVTASPEQIQELRQRISELVIQLNELRARFAVLRGGVTNSATDQPTTDQPTTNRPALKLWRVIHQGEDGDDVRLIQKLLATDSDLYPEGLETGYFGPLTTLALLRFQSRADLPRTGIVDGPTRDKLNQILAAGVPGTGTGLITGDSGRRIPPGLLRAPGIRSIWMASTTIDHVRYRASDDN